MICIKVSSGIGVNSSTLFRYHDEKELYLHFDAKAYGEFVDYYEG